MWGRWVAAVSRPADTRPLAALRILLPLCILLDLLRAIQVGMAPHYWHLFEYGGLSAFSGEDFWLADLGPEGGMLLLGVTLLCMTLGMLGIGARPALLIGILAYAQLGHLYPTGDRGVDRILRLALLVLLFSPAHRRWSLGDRLLGRAPITEAPGWPGLLLRWFLVILYLNAGVAKLIQQPRWLALDGTPVLYRILTDPQAGALDHLRWLWAWPLLRLGGWLTILLELSSPLLLTRLAPWWAIGGALMHLGIALTMNLGVFSWGMLSLYPVLFAPWWLPALDRWQQRRQQRDLPALPPESVP